MKGKVHQNERLSQEECMQARDRGNSKATRKEQTDHLWNQASHTEAGDRGSGIYSKNGKQSLPKPLGQAHIDRFSVLLERPRRIRNRNVEHQTQHNKTIITPDSKSQCTHTWFC